MVDSCCRGGAGLVGDGGSCDPASFRNLLKVKREEVWVSDNETHSAKGTFGCHKHLSTLSLPLLINLDLAAFLPSYIVPPVKDKDFFFFC